MKQSKFRFALALAAALSFFTAAVTAETPVKTLRSAAVDAPEAPLGNHKQLPDGPPLPRDFVQQPPLVPHKTDGYEVTMNFNRCMDCHSWSRYRETGATKVSLTHFKDRDGGELSNVSPRRYFCMQCHASQTDAKPLVGNTFQRVEGLR
ncbi:MAG TPA: nitrate reductase cytochrome c-type subunit [Candidimonas sp.]|nr:nitrate reductase cytochrome c-type subunit [Candidimonas sp.]